MGEYHDACGDILRTVGIFSTVEDIMINVGGYHEYRRGGGVFSTMADTILCNLSTMGDIMIHVGISHEYCGGCSVPWGYSNNRRFIPPWY